MREAAQVLGNLGAAVEAQQTASEGIQERIDGMEKRHARDTASMEGALAGITRAIEALDQRVAEATSSLVARPPTPRGTVGDSSPFSMASVEAGAASGSDAAAQLEGVREKITQFEQLRMSDVTGSRNTPQVGTPAILTHPVGDMPWNEDKINWSEYLNQQIPINPYLGTMVHTVPSTTIQASTSRPENVGISNQTSVPITPPGLSQLTQPPSQSIRD